MPVSCMLNPWPFSNMIGKAWKARYKIPRINAFLNELHVREQCHRTLE